MYYRKYYVGTIEAGSVTNNVASVNGINSSIQVNHTEILNRAVEDILTEIGMDCSYDPTTYILTIEGCPFNLFVNSNLTWKMIRKAVSGADHICAQTTSVSYSPFSGVNYKFYITVRGDPKGLLAVYIGYYSVPAVMNYGFQIGFGKDIRDDGDIVFIAGPATNSLYVQKKDGSLPEGVIYNAVYAFSRYITADNGLSKDGSQVPLIELFADCGFFKMNNCFFNYSGLTAANFYDIGGDIYYCMNQYMLVKCITELPE